MRMKSSGSPRAARSRGLCPITEGNLGDGIFPRGSITSPRAVRFGIGTDSDYPRRCGAGAPRARIFAAFGAAGAGGAGRTRAAPFVGADLFARAVQGGAQALECYRLGLAVGRAADIVSARPRSPLPLPEPTMPRRCSTAGSSLHAQARSTAVWRAEGSSASRTDAVSTPMSLAPPIARASRGCSREPRTRRIREEIAASIESGEWRPGRPRADRGGELCGTPRLHRRAATVSKALGELAPCPREGSVERRREGRDVSFAHPPVRSAVSRPCPTLRKTRRSARRGLSRCRAGVASELADAGRDGDLAGPALRAGRALWRRSDRLCRSSASCIALGEGAPGGGRGLWRGGAGDVAARPYRVGTDQARQRRSRAFA